jgi:uncharacterized protein YcgL (UPF0745 family)
VNDSDGFSALEVDVYKTPRRPQTFLYVPRGLQPDQWPVDLVDLFRDPQKVLSLTLTAEQPLAAQSATVVIEAIRSRRYFIQLPPDPQGGCPEREQASC